ncbi:TetR/AcrR family transcriptional regulator [Antrihabitans sp. YC2-6]|uniref:TetR/AcrR family transcriptional regulator n=1 Tax=Antrihabitans sp. YC2-6 TaxID=2799498 RepID=UPI001F266343|nr:TetR/AcrR family transcriptional regulator [Antrihabitans sp. YC2-6]
MSRKATSQKTAKSRLTVDDWIAGALALLRREGVGAIRIPRLCEELGVTKGSFYWHFDDVDQLLEAITDYWCGTQNDAVRGLSELESLSVAERLEVMGTRLTSESAWTVESTVRDWARTNERVAKAVRELDLRIFEVIQKSLLELDLTPEQARTRAGVLVFAGIGFVHGHDSLPTPSAADMRELFSVLMRK